VSRADQIGAARLLEFIGGPGEAVVLVSVHPAHTFNAALERRLTTALADVRLGRVSVLELLATGGAAVQFLSTNLHARGVHTPFGVLPGYYLFSGGRLLAWDAGLPGLEDGRSIAGSLLLGTICAGVTRDMSFIVQALRLAADESGAARVTDRFHDILARHRSQKTGGAAHGSRPSDDIQWASSMLGVKPTASDREIHRAWRRRRVECHPDRARNRADFKRRSRISVDINRARDILLNLRPASGHAR
jgi:DnaJ domain